LAGIVTDRLAGRSGKWTCTYAPGSSNAEGLSTSTSTSSVCEVTSIALALRAMTPGNRRPGNSSSVSSTFRPVAAARDCASGTGT
jgi:hypothetical protein